ncbi:NADPH-dependent ferric siderophore reductase [Algoriphagus sp. 4150]|uniref:FAD-binding oxidoreductase n=1 Tax=Algoriphagus sp. 4150 TaxID=2817756 RepID=UPI002856C3C8|nr:FAD-binding oxidoreductase [Algoriphagus sp. 4150]MDR7128164.1 NADPH-dependent ferric siderophore reductase [Algoriphagus sp. 4150]
MISSIPKWVGNLFEDTLRPNVKIIASSYLSPQMKLIRFQGDISNMSFRIGYANVIRVSETEFRNYTVAYYDSKNGVLDIIFHIHRKGVGSLYIDSLDVNDELYISPPRGKKLFSPDIKQQVFFGDETSIGLACSALPTLKRNKHQYRFLFELEDENRNVPLLLGLENVTVFSKKDTFRNDKWVSDLSIFKTGDWKDASFVLTGNVKSVQTFRKVLKDKTTGKIRAQGYWLEGKKGL